MNDAENSWKNKPEYNTDFERLFNFNHVLYADDSNLFSTTLQSLRCMLHEVEREAKKYGLRLNVTKTSLICIGVPKNRPKPKMKTLEGKNIPVRDADKTLGFLLGAGGLNKRNISRKVSSLLYTMKKFKLVWTSKMKIKKKVEKYYSLVLSRAAWGVHLLTLGKTDFHTLEYHHNRCLRRILGIKASYISRVSNKDVLVKAGTHSIQYFIIQKQLQLLGHIMRLPPDHPDRLVTFQRGTDCDPCFPEEFKRRRGRPTNHWAEVLITKIRSIYKRKTKKEIFEWAQDRDKWNSFCVRGVAAQFWMGQP